MSTKPRPTSRDLKSEIEAAGGIPHRNCRSSFKEWILPSGAKVKLDWKHPNKTIGHHIVNRIRAALAAELAKQEE